MRKFLTLLAAVAMIGFAQADHCAGKHDKTSASFAVSGMTCGGCSGKMKRALAAIDGVDVDKVCHKSGSACVKYDAKKVKTEDLVAAIKETGFKLDGQKVSFDVAGMTCGGCSGKVKRALAKIDGVSTSKVCHKSDHAEVVFDPSKTCAGTVEKAITASGFKIVKGEKVSAEKAGKAECTKGASECKKSEEAKAAPAVK